MWPFGNSEIVRFGKYPYLYEVRIRGGKVTDHRLGLNVEGTEFSSWKEDSGVFTLEQYKAILAPYGFGKWESPKISEEKSKEVGSRRIRQRS